MLHAPRSSVVAGVLALVLGTGCSGGESNATVPPAAPASLTEPQTPAPAAESMASEPAAPPEEPSAPESEPEPETRAEASAAVEPEINERWRSEKIGPLIDILESEQREIYTKRRVLAAVVGPKPGSVVADVGAGSGFMVELFARQVGSDGKAIAVDINPTMMKRVKTRARKRGLSNVETVVGTDRSAQLPANSVDVAFICDAYHHFEYPSAMMDSIHQALRPGGQVVLVDFRRDPEVLPKSLMDHVRAGQKVFTREILDAGFELTNEHIIPGLDRNYVLRFRKLEAED